MAEEFTPLSRMEIHNEEAAASIAQYLDGGQAGGPSTSEQAALLPDDHLARFMNNAITYEEYVALSSEFPDETDVEQLADDEPIASTSAGAGGKQKKKTGGKKALFADLQLPDDLLEQFRLDKQSGEFAMSAAREGEQPGGSERPSKAPRLARRQNKVVDNLMGQANVAYANNRIEEALSFLREAIRQDPRLPDAYQQISDIYAERNQAGRAFEYRLLAAHLDARTTAADWAEIGEAAVQLERIEEAAACYGSAVRCEPWNWFYYEKRIELLEALGLSKFAMRIRLNAAQAIDCRRSGMDFEWLQALIKTAAEHYIACMDEEKAMETLKVFLLRCHEFGRTADVQLLALLAMWISRERYEECVKAILSLCPGIQALTADETPAMEITVSNLGYTIEPFMPPTVDHFTIAETVNTVVLGKLIVCLLHLQQLKPVDSLVDVLLKRAIHDAEEENVFLEIGRAYHKAELFNHGLAYMRRLLELDAFAGNPDALFVLGTLEHSRGHPEEALRMYRAVLDTHPAYVTARINLSTILQQRGETEAALQILMDYDLDSCSQLPDERLLMRQAEVLEDRKQSEAYVRCIRMLLVPYFFVIFKDQNYTKRSRTRATQCGVLYKTMIEVLRGSPIEKQIKRQGAVAVAEGRTSDLLSATDLHDHCLRLVETFYEQRRFKEALEIVCLANLQPKIQTSPLSTFFDLILLVSTRAGAFQLAFEYLRYIYSNLPNKTVGMSPVAVEAYHERMYNAINFVFCHYQNIAYHRFTVRAEVRTPCDQLRVISGNNSLVTGSYRHAISEYLQVWSRNKKDPLMTLLIALTFTHMACKKDISGKHMLAMRGIAFMQRYREKRGALKQEVFYNIGRLFHQLGILPAAIHFYKRTLNETEPPTILTAGEGGEQERVERADRYDLRPCAAHNLALIYEYSGNLPLARSYLEQWCVI
ncbi:General transcription factor 3C polypeptide 3 [Aphelenchoides fujianensis]|nr:General transcription factor 3C polypeptide 3 [Aphelenchoides fujianensis]